MTLLKDVKYKDTIVIRKLGGFKNISENKSYYIISI